MIVLIVFQVHTEVESTGDPSREASSWEISVKILACTTSWVSAVFSELPKMYQTYSGPVSNIQFHLGNNFLISLAILCGTLKELGLTLQEFLWYIHKHDVRLGGRTIMQIMTS